MRHAPRMLLRLIAGLMVAWMWAGLVAAQGRDPAMPPESQLNRFSAEHVDLGRSPGSEAGPSAHARSDQVLPRAAVLTPREPPWQARDVRLQLQMGLLLGFTLALLGGCVWYGTSLREPLFLWYAVLLCTSTAHGAAAQGPLGLYLGPANLWWTVHGAPLLMALSFSATCIFYDRVLNVAALQRGCSRALCVMAGSGLVLALVSSLQWLERARWNEAFAVLGFSAALLGGYCAWQRWRRGDRAAGGLLIERVIHSAGLLITAGVAQGGVSAETGTPPFFWVTSALTLALWSWAVGARARVRRDTLLRRRAGRTRLQMPDHTDAVTGQLNRRGLRVALIRALAHVSPTQQLAVFVLGLDGFKAVHQTHGPSVGPLLLAAVAQRLRSCLRAADIVANLGSEGFVVAAVGLPKAVVATRIARVLQQQFDAPFRLPKAQCRLGVTIGYAVAPADGIGVDGLLRAADQALYAGRRGSNPLQALEYLQRLRRGRAVVLASMPAPLRD